MACSSRNIPVAASCSIFPTINYEGIHSGRNYVSAIARIRAQCAARPRSPMGRRQEKRNIRYDMLSMTMAGHPQPTALGFSYRNDTWMTQMLSTTQSIIPETLEHNYITLRIINLCDDQVLSERWLNGDLFDKKKGGI